MMQRIVITWPEFFPGEAAHIVRLLDEGVDRIHLRKPDSTIEQCARLLDAIPPACYSRISLHDHFALLQDYALGGVHLNRRNPVAPQLSRDLLVSRSCHSLDEVVAFKPICDYVFLSPVFDSISKQGYRSAFSDAVLSDAARQGIIDSQVYALGGISEDKLPLLSDWHFGGYVQLGAVWKPLLK